MASFGRYEILNKLGAGAMGVVYRARDEGLGRIVALKMLPEETGTDTEQYQRFRREAEAIGCLNHPNVVKVYDLGATAGSLYMAMELLEGDDLRSLIAQRAAIPMADRVRILAEICGGLEYAHSRGVVHRDLKPANILVTRSGRVKILDFGLARVATGKAITRRGVILGTPDYMAPEQAVGKQVTPLSDMFSAGAVFYEFLTLQRPFLGRTLHSVLFQVISEMPKPVLTMNPDIPTRVAIVLDRMLRKEPSERFDGMKTVAGEMQRLHAAMRRSRSLSTWLGAEREPGPEQGQLQSIREHLARGRALLEARKATAVVAEMADLLALDPDCAEAHELLWRAGGYSASSGSEGPKA